MAAIADSLLSRRACLLLLCSSDVVVIDAVVFDLPPPPPHGRNALRILATPKVALFSYPNMQRRR